MIQTVKFGEDSPSEVALFFGTAITDSVIVMSFSEATAILNARTKITPNITIIILLGFIAPVMPPFLTKLSI